MRLSIAVLAAVFLIGCRGASSPAPNANETAAPASVPGAAASSGTVTLPTGYPDRPFVRVEFEKLTWRPTEGNTLGVETAVVEGDPSKPGYYLTINHFPPGVMSRPHYHPDERYVIVLRGTWYTDEGDVFRPKESVPLKPGDFMRHPRAARTTTARWTRTRGSRSAATVQRRPPSSTEASCSESLAREVCSSA